jgi:hypothetical protein
MRWVVDYGGNGTTGDEGVLNRDVPCFETQGCPDHREEEKSLKL